jgi:YD repeat-containing protein
MTGALCTLPVHTSRATIDPQYQCTPTGSKCAPAKHYAWRWFVVDVSPYSPPGVWFNSEGEADAAIGALATGPGGWCSISNPQDSAPYGQNYVGSSLIVADYNTTFTAIGTTDSNHPCEYQTTWHATVVKERVVKCNRGWTLVTDGTTGPYCACPWSSTSMCAVKPCYKGCVDKGEEMNALSGVVRRKEVDYGPPSSSLRYERLYNSSFAREHPFGTETPPAWSPLGIGWSSVYFQTVSYSDVPGYSGLIAMRADGSELAFNETSPNVFTYGSEIADQVQRTFDGGGNQTGWKYITGSDDVELYDLNGKLLSITTRAGVVLTLQYGSSGYLSTVTDSFGHQLTFNWTTDLHVQSVTLPDGGQVTYSYSAQGNLASANYPGSVSHTYFYDNGGTNQLSGVQDESGIRYVTWLYDAGTGLASGSSLAGGVGNYAINYYIGWNKRVVTDPLGTDRTYTIAMVHGEPRYISATSTCAGCGEAASAGYDAYGNPSTQTDFNGNNWPVPVSPDTDLSSSD